MPTRRPLRYTVPALLFVVGTIIIVFYYLNDARLMDQRLHREAERELRVVGALTGGDVEASFRVNDSAGARAAMERLGSNRRIASAALVNVDGKVMLSNRSGLAGRRVTDAMPGIPDSFIRHAIDSQRIVIEHDDRPPAVYGSFPIRMRRLPESFLPTDAGRLLVDYDLSEVRAWSLYNLRLRTIPYAVVLMAICVGLWLFFRRALLVRINRLAAATRAIAKGDYSMRPEVGGGDEIADLADDFRTMAESLRQHSSRLVFLSGHDSLTFLLNRAGFEAELDNQIRALRHSDTRMLLCYLDIDGFRVINDTKGHAAGDELLEQVAHMLRDAMPEEALLARTAGDEFAVLNEIPAGMDIDEAVRHCRPHVRDFRFQWQDESFPVRFTVGAVMVDARTPDAAKALSLADAACFAAKERTHDRLMVWKPGDRELEVKHGQMRWVSRIQSALDEKRFVLFAQEIRKVAAKGDDGLHLELLVRMKEPNGRLISPDRFLPAAERYRLVGQIDRFVVSHAIDTLAAHPQLLERLEMCAINLSGLSLGNRSLVELVSAGLRSTPGLLPEQLCFEVTETAAVTQLDVAARFIHELKGLGCRFALDDFGSGVSSFGYLKNLPVDFIKIDGLFIRGVHESAMDRAIVRSINDIAHEMGMRTIAEFVESREIMRELGKMGVDYMQGHGIGRAVPLEEYIEKTLPRQVSGT